MDNIYEVFIYSEGEWIFNRKCSSLEVAVAYAKYLGASYLITEYNPETKKRETKSKMIKDKEQER